MLLIISSFFLITFLLIKWFSNPSKTKNSPPSPPTIPIFGNLHQLGAFPHRKFQSLAKKYGPLMKIQLGNVPALVVSSADAARDILKTHELVFTDRSPKKMYDMLLYNFRDVSSSPYGEYWRQIRSITVLHLLSAKRVKLLRSMREEEIGLMIEKIKKYSSSSLPMDITDLTSTTINDMTCRGALGRKYSGERGEGFKKLLLDFTELLGIFFVGDYVPWLNWVTQLSGLYTRARKVSKELDELFEDVIEDHISRQKGDNDDGDFVDVLLRIQRTESLGFPIDRTVIKALLLDMFVAGSDTMSTFLEWAMTELILHPDIMKKLQDECKSVAGDRTQITEDDLNEMKYLKAVVKEALRLHHPFPTLVPRVCREDTKVNGYHIEAGTRIIVNGFAIARDPKYWDQPDEFKPERFLNNSVDIKGSDFQLIPFGAGRRICPGIVYAMVANEIVLANLVHQFNWSLPGGAGLETLDLSETVGLSMHRKIPLVAVPTLI